MLFGKIVKRQGEKIIEQDKEIDELNARCVELARYLKDSDETMQKLIDEIIINLLNLQEINNLGISEEEKNKYRNSIINRTIKELSSNPHRKDNS